MRTCFSETSIYSGKRESKIDCTRDDEVTQTSKCIDDSWENKEQLFPSCLGETSNGGIPYFSGDCGQSFLKRCSMDDKAIRRKCTVPSALLSSRTSAVIDHSEISRTAQTTPAQGHTSFTMPVS